MKNTRDIKELVMIMRDHVDIEMDFDNCDGDLSGFVCQMVDENLVTTEEKDKILDHYSKKEKPNY